MGCIKIRDLDRGPTSGKLPEVGPLLSLLRK